MSVIDRRLRILESRLAPRQAPCPTCAGHPVQVIGTDGPALPDDRCPDCGRPATGRVRYLDAPLASYRRVTQSAPS